MFCCAARLRTLIPTQAVENGTIKRFTINKDNYEYRAYEFF